MSIAKKVVPSALVLALTSIFVNVLWGTPFPLVKEMYVEMNLLPSILGDNYNGQVLTAISIRFFLAGIMTLLMAMCMKQNIFAVSKKQWKDVTYMGLVSTTAAYFFFNIGLVHTVTIKSSILAQASIFFSVLLAHFAYKNDRMNKAKWIGLLFGFAGLVIVNVAKPTANISELFSFNLLGDGFMLLYGLVAAIGMMQARAIGSTLPVFVMTGWNLLIGSIVLFAIGIFMGGSLSLIHWTPLGTILLVFLALLSSVTFGLWYWVVQYAKIGEVSMYKFFMPVSGSLLAIMIGQDAFTIPLAIGLILVCFGIVIVNKPEILGLKKKTAQQPAETIEKKE
ncbi:DMT family transporter [Zophobihabitans entericus]|uniref:DMT family transporter n=1 Tax=Zophobihabitans entericus TaxID=1635327 RepID=A0A6G9ICB3_9GAMM|nr:DMT family transporter [Zophobihabitans entericus]QIQ21871.1 DMT family transporter [Zophobihabitans entericus]